MNTRKNKWEEIDERGGGGMRNKEREGNYEYGDKWIG